MVKGTLAPYNRRIAGQFQRRKMELRKFDPVDFLDSDEVLVEYLSVALQENDPKYFAKALGNVARAKGMTTVSEATGLGR